MSQSLGSRRGARRAITLAAALALIVASCGSDSSSSGTTAPGAAPTSPPTTAAAPNTSAGTSSTDTGGSAATTGGSAAPDGTSAAPADDTGSAGCPPIDDSNDADNGKDAGKFVSDLTCADSKPLKAEGEPIVIGFQNPEGDPNGSFPQYSAAAQAATNYINEELGGLGADVQNGKPGRPIQLDVCKMAISPDDSQRCANELVSKKPALVISSLNYFGNHFPVYAAAKVPVIAGTAVTIGDFTSPNVYTIGGGGGCVGNLTAMMYEATHDLNGRHIAIPWSDTPPGVVCYYDTQAKALDVLNGSVQGSSKEAGTMPDLQYLGVPIKPASPDVTAQATQILDYKPDVIVYTAQSADCWNLVAALGRLGWTPDSIPLVLSGACIDYAAMTAAGDLAKGVYFVSAAGGGLLNDPATAASPMAEFEATNYQTKPVQYGLPKDNVTLPFSTSGWSLMLAVWEITGEMATAGTPISGDSIAAAFAATDNQHLFGSTPISCAKAPKPYVAICNSDATINVWDGKQLVAKIPRLNASELIEGTELRPGP